MRTNPGWRSLQAVVACSLLWCLAACADEVGTSVRVRLVYQDTWPIESTELRVDDQVHAIRLEHELLLLVPDERDGEVLEISVASKRGTEDIANGSGVALVRRGETVDAAIVLARVPCGVFCEPGAKRCEGENAAVECVRNPEGCTEWGELQECPDDLRICSSGLCDSNCKNECLVIGEGRCEDASHQVVCGMLDTDDCLDLSLPTECNSGQVCYSGKCRPACTYAGSMGSVAIPGSTRAFGPAIAIDSMGTAHVIYSADVTRQLRYNSRPKDQAWAGTWQDVTGAVGEAPVITMDKQRNLHLVYGGTSVVYGMRTATTGTWAFATVATGAGVGSVQSIAVTASGEPHIVFFNSVTNKLLHGFRSNNTWMTEDVTASVGLGRGCDIAIADDVLHVSSYATASSDLWYSVKAPGGQWTSERVITLPNRTVNTTANTTIAVDRAKTVHLVYSDLYQGLSTFYDPRYGYKTAASTSWVADIPIDTASERNGAYPELAVDPFDNLHLVHRTTSAPFELRYARSPAGYPTTWELGVQPPLAITGFQPSIAVGPDADVRIVSAEGATVVETSRLCPTQ